MTERETGDQRSDFFETLWSRNSAGESMSRMWLLVVAGCVLVAVIVFLIVQGGRWKAEVSFSEVVGQEYSELCDRGATNEEIGKWALMRLRKSERAVQKVSIGKVASPLIEILDRRNDSEGWGRSPMGHLFEWFDENGRTLAEVAQCRGGLLAILASCDPDAYGKVMSEAVLERGVLEDLDLMGHMPFWGKGSARWDTAILGKLIATGGEFEQFVALGFMENSVVSQQDYLGRTTIGSEPNFDYSRRGFEKRNEEVLEILRGGGWAENDVILGMRDYVKDLYSR